MRIWTSNVCALILAFSVLAACAPPISVLEVDTPRATVVLDESYVLGPGDELNIVVFQHENLSALCSRDDKSSRCAVVSEAGTISLPLVGEIGAAGRTIDAVRQEYSDRLADGYLVNPNVSVNISKYRPFFIIGGVNEPGAYPYITGMTILHAIALAGGHSELAIKDAAPLLLRASGAPVSSESISVRAPVFPGDLIEIPERAFTPKR